MKPTIYISIPMTGKDMQIQRNIANAWQSYFESRDFDVINPFWLSDELDKVYIDKLRGKTPTYDDYLFHDLLYIPDCTHLFLCNGWQNSKGCIEEVEKSMKYKIKYIFEANIKLD